MAYGTPGQTFISPKPPCFGTNKYDNEDRECRNCGFQNTCRDSQLRKVAVAPPPTVQYYQQFQPQQTYATPKPATQIIPVKPETSPSPVVKPAQGQVAAVRDKYGQFTDPMFTTLKSTPSVMRPQLPGEKFSERLAKNMILASAEAGLGELLLALRQFLWAPEDKDE